MNLDDLKISIFVLILAFLAVPAMGMEFIHEWTLEGFSDPESAAIDLSRDAIYISNVNGYALDGNGFITRVSMDGKTIDRQWIRGINSPTGVAIHANKLYFADVDSLVIVDIESARISQRIPAPDAEKQPALNDVVISGSGDVYISGSRSRTIYKLKDEHLTVWLQDDYLLQSANGLLIDGDKLIHGGERWTIFDLNTKSVVENGIRPPKGFRDFDGIMHDGNYGYLTTLIGDDRLWRVSAVGTKPVSEELLQGIDMDLRGNYLALPRVGGKLTLFRVSPHEIE